MFFYHFSDKKLEVRQWWLNSSSWRWIQWSPQDMPAHHSGNQKFQSHYWSLHSISYCCRRSEATALECFLCETVATQYHAPNEEGKSINESDNFMRFCRNMHSLDQSTTEPFGTGKRRYLNILFYKFRAKICLLSYLL